jgi:hypothetical protein
MAKQSQWVRRIARLKSMSGAELVDRVRQHIAARIDAHHYRKGHDFTVGPPGSLAGARGKFFFEGSEVQVVCDLLKQRFPSIVSSIVARAERVCQHRFDLLGYEDLDYGAEIDWHLDLVHGKRGPRKPWFQVKYLDFQEVGDSKITWELNRHQHLVTLAKAYRLNGDEKFATEIVAQWRHWQRENPYPIGMNWASNLEVGFRTLSWIWAYFLLQGTTAMTPELSSEWIRAMGLNGRHLETYFSTYFSPNTHLLGEAVALFFLGTLFPEYPSARRWQQRGWATVVGAAKQQVRADGFYFEQSTYYHVYALDLFLHARVLAALNRVEIPAEYDATLVKMLEALCLVGRAGIVPSFGDDDGGRLFDSSRNRAEHLLDPLSTGAVLFQRGDFKFVAGGPREETLWLVEGRGLEEFERVDTIQPSGDSFALKESGLYLMADAECGQQMLVDSGPQGPGTAGHGHADALSLNLSSNGQMLLMDVGTLEYVGETATDRNRFRGTAAHNTLGVDGLDQADSVPPFAWTNLPIVQAECWVTGRQFNLFVGSHKGYERLPAPVSHRRWVFHRKSHFWLVRDVATGSGKHELELSWHLGPWLSPTSARDYLFGSDQESFAIVTTEGHGWSQSAQRGNWSPVYGRQERATVVTFGTKMALPAEFVTLLLSNAVLHEGIGRLERLASNSTVAAYRYSREAEEHYFFFANQANPWTQGAWTSDARFLYWSKDPKHDCKSLIMCGGSLVERAGFRILASEERLDYAEVLESSDKTELLSSSPDRVQWHGPLERMETGPALSENDPIG